MNKIWMIDLNLQGSRRCRAKVITEVINDKVAIVGIKGSHNHPVIIKREKPLSQMIGRENRVLRSAEMQSQMCKDAPTDPQYLYMEDDDYDEGNNM